MKTVERALCSLEWGPAGASVLDMLEYECTTKEARCASWEGWAHSHLELYLVFWENQVIKSYVGDVWSVRNKKGWLVPTAYRPNEYKGTEVWVKGKPHAIKIIKRQITPAIKKFCRKMKLQIIEL